MTSALRIKDQGRAACVALSGIVLELRRIGADEDADAITRLMESVSRLTGRLVVKHDPRRVVGSATVGPAWGPRLVHGGKPRGER